MSYRHMDHRTLRTAILADADCLAVVKTYVEPKDPDYAAKDAAIADLCRAKGIGASSRQVPCHEFKKYLLVRGKWRGIKAAAADDDAAFAAVELAEDARMTADMMDPKAGPMLAALESSGLLDAQDVAALRSMCAVPSAVTPADVSIALRNIKD